MTVALREGVYSFYLGHDGGEVRHDTSDPKAFVKYLGGAIGGPLSGDSYAAGYRNYLCSTGYGALQSGHLEAAAAAFEQAIEWGHDVALVGAALVLAERGDDAGARKRLARLDAAAAVRPWKYQWFGPVEVFFSAALTDMYKSPRYEQMREFWTRILVLDQGRADALYGRGFAHEMLKDWGAAASDLEAALERLPRSQMRSLAWQRLATVCLEDGDVEKALEVTGKAIAEDEGLAHTHRLQRVKCLVHLGRHREALPLFDALFESTPMNGLLYLERGDIYEHLGDIDAAIADWRAALDKYGTRDEAKERLVSHSAPVNVP